MDPGLVGRSSPLSHHFISYGLLKLNMKIREQVVRKKFINRGYVLFFKFHLLPSIPAATFL